MLGNVNAASPARPARKNDAVSVKLLCQIDVFDRPMRAVHFPSGDVQVKSQLFQLLGGQERDNRMNLIVYTNLVLARCHIPDQPKVRILLMDCLISENTWVAAQLIELRRREVAISLSNPLGSVFANASAKLDLAGLALPVLIIS